MLNERISVTVTNEEGTKRNIDLYDNVPSSLEECFTTESELAWYVLECAETVEEIETAVSITAYSTITNGSRELARLETQVR